MDFRMIETAIKRFENQQSRELKRIRTTSPAVDVNKYT